MKSKIIKIILLAILVFPINVFSNNKIDSLLNVLKSSNDSAKIDILTQLSWEYRVSDPAKTVNYGLEA